MSKTMATAPRTKVLQPLHQASKSLLEQEWDKVLAEPLAEPLRDEEWGGALETIITKGGSTYPYVLLGQVLAKAADGSINTLCLQDSSLLPGARDVRMLVRNVVVPWNSSVGKPFPGTNPDPYVNNPARYKNFGEEMASKAGNRALYDSLFKIISHVESGGQEEALRFLRLILIETRVALETNKRDYVGPSRASLEDVTKVLEEFLSERSNGVRLQVVCYSVFKAFAEAFPSFGEVRSYSTNSADASGSRAGDVERIADGKVNFAIEVKDRTLTLSDVESSIMKARITDVKNLVFLVQASPLLQERDEIMKRAAHEFTRGIDVNITESISFFKTVLLLLSPEQRAALLRVVHDALHELGAHYKHVHRWVELMKSI
ncbi:hypothetical protein GCM10027046_26040 [Uliginosibacterium flavum]|uniref:Restriction endonuclease, SacI family n=1 Tax=Uliginosibacterium flavum TaxID=1396831 RepID=A0ABV2TMA0_9RHOO